MKAANASAAAKKTPMPAANNPYTFTSGSVWIRSFFARFFSTFFAPQNIAYPVYPCYAMYSVNKEVLRLQKVLIADNSRIFTDALSEMLQAKYQVMICADGKTAMECITSWKPDVLILNLMIPYVDGITLLQELEYHPPVIMAITTHMTVYVEQAVSDLGIDYTMIAPSVRTVARRLEDLLAHYTAPSEDNDIHAQILHHLHLLNVPTHLDGYRQLCLALPLFLENPNQFLTKELYPEVAKRSGCKDGRSVEHSIRKAIYAAWKHRDNANWRKYFPLGPQGKIPCPSNKVFICRLVEILSAAAKK